MTFFSFGLLPPNCFTFDSPVSLNLILGSYSLVLIPKADSIAIVKLSPFGEGARRIPKFLGNFVCGSMILLISFCRPIIKFCVAAVSLSAVIAVPGLFKKCSNELSGKTKIGFAPSSRMTFLAIS